MRNLKKVLALALALVMCLSLMTVANAFTDSKDVNATYEEAVEVLNGLGVLKGYTDGSFQPKGEITRAEVAAVIYRIVTGDVDNAQVNVYSDYARFNDVKSTAWYAGYVGYCANAEYIKGYGNDNFGPNDLVTGYQALAMILRAMGYDQNGEFTGSGWEIRVASTAQQLGILANVKEGTLGTAATRELVSELIFQAILLPTVTYTPALGYVTNTALGIQTKALCDIFGLQKVTGVVTANEKADLANAGKALTAGTTKLHTGAAYALTTDESLLGHKVSFWASYNTAITTPVDLVTPNKTYGNTVLTDKQWKDYGNSFSTYIECYNYAPATLKQADFGKGVAVEIINNGKDENNKPYPSYVLMVEKTFAEVQYISTTNVITLDSYSTGLNAQVAYDGIAVGDRVLAITYGGKAYIEKANYVTGNVSGYTNTLTERTATIGGEKYAASDLENTTKYSTVEDFEFGVGGVPSTYAQVYNGTTWDYFLDDFNNIIAYDYASELAVDYALILDYGKYVSGPWTKELWVKYLTTAGKVESALVDEATSTYFSTRDTEGEVVLYRLNDDGEFVIVYQKNDSGIADARGQYVAIDPTYDVAYVGNGLQDASLYAVNKDFVAFYYVKPEQGDRSDAYYGVLTGAAAIADLSVKDLASLTVKAGKELTQKEVTPADGSHTSYAGTLNMVNVRDYISAGTQFCYIADTGIKNVEYVNGSSLYYYNAIGADGKTVPVATYDVLDADDGKVWAYQERTENWLSGTVTYNALVSVESLGYTVLYGDLHSTNDSLFRVYDQASQYPVTLNLPSFIANAKGGEAKLDATWCATGYVVADTTLVDAIKGIIMGDYGYELLDGEPTTTVGSLVGAVIPDAKAVFVTETVTNTPSYIDCTVNELGTEKKVHLQLGSAVEFKAEDDTCYKVTIDTEEKPLEFHTKDIEDGKFTLKVTKAWADGVKIEKIEDCKVCNPDKTKFDNGIVTGVKVNNVNLGAPEYAYTVLADALKNAETAKLADQLDASATSKIVVSFKKDLTKVIKVEAYRTAPASVVAPTTEIDDYDTITLDGASLEVGDYIVITEVYQGVTYYMAYVVTK